MTPETAIISAEQGNGGGHGSAPPFHAPVPRPQHWNRSGSSSGHPRQRTRYGATEPIGATSARGAALTAYPPYRLLLRP